jgi:YHS domain-containing protein
MKYVIAGLVVVGLLFSVGVKGYAQSTGVEGTKQVVAAGNKFCPVSGDPVSGKDFVEYNGKSYGLCCPGCAATFLKEPEKYIEKMEKQEAMPEHQNGGMHGGQGMMPSGMGMADEDNKGEHDMGHMGHM